MADVRAEAAQWEEYVVGCLMRAGPAELRLIDVTEEEWFTLNDLRTVLGVLKKIVSGGVGHLPPGSVPDVSVLFHVLVAQRGIADQGEQAKWWAYLQRLMNYRPEPTSLAHGMKLLRDAYTINVITQRAQRALRSAVAGDAASTWRELYQIPVGDPTTDLTRYASSATATLDYADDLEERAALLRQRRDDPERRPPCIPTGIPPLDQYVLDGGLRCGEFGAVFGCPKAGKSILLMQIAAEAALRGDYTVFFALEMQARETAHRADAYFSRIDSKRFRTSDLSDAEIEHWLEHARGIARNHLKIIPVPEGCSTRVIEARLREEHALSGFWPRLIVVDYGGIMSPVSGSQDLGEWKPLLQVAMDLKRLALLMAVPVWSAFQLVPQAKSKTSLTQVDVGFSKAGISAAVDWGLGLIRTEEMEETNQLNVQVVLTRHGARQNVVSLRPNYPIVRAHDPDASPQRGVYDVQGAAAHAGEADGGAGAAHWQTVRAGGGAWVAGGLG